MLFLSTAIRENHIKPKAGLASGRRFISSVAFAVFFTVYSDKCDEKFGIGLSPLIKVFLKAFVTQKGVGFYIGDDDLCNLFAKWLIKKRMDKGKNGGSHLYGPYLKDLYHLGNTGKMLP